MTAVSGWTGAVNEILCRRNRPDKYTDEGFDPPCPIACNQAVKFCYAINGRGFTPTRVENDPNGGIHIAGNGWYMTFWEPDAPAGVLQEIRAAIKSVEHLEKLVEQLPVDDDSPESGESGP